MHDSITQKQFYSSHIKITATSFTSSNDRHMLKLFQDTLTEKKTVIHQCGRKMSPCIKKERQQQVYTITPLTLDYFVYHCF